jgi:winged helix-turn-helix DNA-binding protein
MSMVDQVRKLEQEVVSRLKELEPLKGEYDQLRKLAARLGVKYSPGSGDGARPASRSRRPGKPAAAAKRAPGRKAKAAKPRASTGAAKSAAKPRATRSTAASRTSAPATPSGADGKAATRRPRKRAATGGRRSAGRRSAPRPGQRHDDVLRLVRENPGITVREIGERLGVDSTGLYRVVNRLTDEGRLRKDGTRLRPVDASTASVH